MWVLEKFDGQILDDSLATTIVGELIRYGLYRPTEKTATIAAKWNGTPQGSFADTLLTNKEVLWMITNNPQEHKEAGFDRGYPSRFATIFDFTKELGFVYFNPGSPIQFSEIGRKLAQMFEITVNGDDIGVEEVHPEYEQQAFLHAMCKSQRANPFVRVLNDNVPLLLLLNVIKLLNADPDYNGVGITRQELPLLIFWKDNDAMALYHRIKQLREEYRYTPSDEVVVEICIDEIMEGDYKKFAPESIMRDYVDEFIRKMRITGLISLRGAGRFVDINHNEDEKIEYILSHYSSYKKYATEKEYFDYMAEIDPNLFDIKPKEISASQSEALLVTWLKTYNWETIKSELTILAKRKTTEDAVLKFVPAPARLEFLTALSIKAKMPDVRVAPNYACDDTGLPTSTAGGNAGDIECHEDRNGILVEVTMAEGRTQTMMEIWPIERHLVDFKTKTNDEAQAVFVAPSIYQDSFSQINYVRFKNGHIIRPYKIEEFITYMDKNTKLYNAQV